MNASQVNTDICIVYQCWHHTLWKLTLLWLPGTPAGPYTLTYQICEVLNPSNCDTAIVTVPVGATAIVANDDAGTSVNGYTGGTAFTNVLTNDTLNGVAVVPSQVTTTATPFKVSLVSTLVKAVPPVNPFTEVPLSLTASIVGAPTGTVTIAVSQLVGFNI